MPTRTTNTIPSVPLPAGATKVGEWHDSPYPEAVNRHFLCKTYEVFDWLAVHSGGLQLVAPGEHTIVRTVSVSRTGAEVLSGLFPEQAVELASALNQAAKDTAEYEVIETCAEISVAALESVASYVADVRARHLTGYDAAS